MQRFIEIKQRLTALKKYECGFIWTSHRKTAKPLLSMQQTPQCEKPYISSSSSRKRETMNSRNSSTALQIFSINNENKYSRKQATQDWSLNPTLPRINHNRCAPSHNFKIHRRLPSAQGVSTARSWEIVRLINKKFDMSVQSTLPPPGTWEKSLGLWRHGPT